MISNLTEELVNYFEEKKVILAFSGGLDSCVLLEIALKSAKKVLPVIVNSVFINDKEFMDAKTYLEKRKINYEVAEVDVFRNHKIIANDFNRCYYCKKGVFSQILRIKNKIGKDFIVVEGSNKTDLEDYRPGIKAVRELKISSPYLELGITKQEIKKIAESLGLDVASKPPNTCTATRLDYDIPITESKLTRIEKAEEYITDLINTRIIRVRDHGDFARIEVPEKKIPIMIREDIRQKIVSKLRDLGFKYITMDLEGYIQGSMNRVIPKSEKQ